MANSVVIALGLVMTVVGALWTGQGLGYFGGSPMTGETAWAIIGPVVAGLGVALLYVGLRGTSGGRSR